jgi:hypothetical protein
MIAKMVANPNKVRIRGEGGQAWTLKGKCRFCGMTRVLFKSENRPDCEWHSKSGKRKTTSTAKASP